MAAPTRPADVAAFGTEKIQLVLTFADYTAPTVTETTAGTALDITGMLFDSAARPDGSTNSVTLPRRVYDTKQFSTPGLTQLNLGELRFQFNQQGAAASDGVLAWEKITDGMSGYLVWRNGIDADTDFATSQFVTVYPVKFGDKIETFEGDGESRVTGFKVQCEVTAEPEKKVALLA